MALLGCLFLISARCEHLEEEPAATETRDVEGVITDKPHLWKNDVTGKGLIWVALSPAIYENIVAVAGATAQEKDMIVGLNIDNREEVWRWTDFLTYDRAGGMNDSEYDINQKDNVWLLQNSYNYYAIDLATGETIWKEKRDMYQDIMIVNPGEELFGVNKHTGEVVWHRNE